MALDWACCVISGESDAVASAGHETFALLRPTGLLLRAARGAWARGAWPPPWPPPTRPGRRIGRRLGHRRRRPQPHHLGLDATASVGGCLRRRAPWLHSLVASAAERSLPRLSQPRAHRPALVPGHRLQEGRVQVQRSVQRSVLRRRRSPHLGRSRRLLYRRLVAAREAVPADAASLVGRAHRRALDAQLASRRGGGTLRDGTVDLLLGRLRGVGLVKAGVGVVAHRDGDGACRFCVRGRHRD
mmetsp:Transcript_13283/g.42591  ORF Transcript_13283/g.42591 Transcript_13283/m.42591 type:complete len:243 (-) Transcript_13283:474-1202(-)